MKRGTTNEERNAYMRDWSLKNPEKVRASAARSYQKHKASRRARVEEFLHLRKEYVRKIKEAPCSDCGLTFHHAAMDFDHVRGEKSACVGNLVKSSSIEKIKEEIAKCELVCSNCHRVRTFNRRDN